MARKKKSQYDAVQAPPHYTFGKIQVVDAILDWNLDFCRGSALKYIARAGRKPGVPAAQDIQKAIRILELYLKHLEQHTKVKT